MPNAIDPKLIAATEARMARSGLWRHAINAGKNFATIPVGFGTAAAANILIPTMALPAIAAMAAGTFISWLPLLGNKPNLLQKAAIDLDNDIGRRHFGIHSDENVAKAHAYFQTSNYNIKGQRQNDKRSYKNYHTNDAGKVDGGLGKETKEFKFLVNNAALALHDAKGNLSDPKVQQAMRALGEKVEPKHLRFDSHRHFFMPDISKHLKEMPRADNVSIAKAYAYFDKKNGNTFALLKEDDAFFRRYVHDATIALHDAKGNFSDPKVQTKMSYMGSFVKPKHMTQVSHQHYLTPAKSPIAPEATKSVFGRVAEFAKGKPWVTAASVAGVGLAGWAVTNALSKPEPSAPIASFSERETARRHASNAQADVATTLA